MKEAVHKEYLLCDFMYVKTSIENKSVAAWEWAHAGLGGKERRRKMDLQGNW